MVTSNATGPVTATFAVTLSAPSTQPVTVSYATSDDNAEAPIDYQATTGALTFLAGSVKHTISVPITANDSEEQALTFFVTLSDPMGAALARPIAVGTIRATGQQLIPSGYYVEDFSAENDPSKPAFDDTGAFQHAFFGPTASHVIDDPEDTDLPSVGYRIGTDFSDDNNEQLILTGATDRITFPNLMPGEQVSFASVDAANWAANDAGEPTIVTIIGQNGTYMQEVTHAQSQTVSVGDEYVLPSGLELGPIQEIDLRGGTSNPLTSASFDNVRILVVPDQGTPLDETVTAPPKTLTTIDVLEYATNEAQLAGLQPPLQFASQNPFTQPDLPGSETAASPATDPNKLVFLYTPIPGQDVHSTASFTYTVVDANGTTATGTVHVTINTPPAINIDNSKNSFPWTSDPDGGLDLAHGTPGPLIGYIDVSDDDGDPVTLTLVGSPVVTLTQTGTNDYTYQYNPPLISSYDSSTGLTAMVSAIVGDDQFTLEATDGFDVTDYAVTYHVADSPPFAASVSFRDDSVSDLIAVPGEGPTFVVPENTGVSYYTHANTDPYYNPKYDAPGWSISQPLVCS